MEVPRSDRYPAPRSLLVVTAIGSLLTVVCILFVDRAVTRSIAGYEPARFWNAGIDGLDWLVGLPVFRWTSGIVLVLGMIVVVAVPRWRGSAPAWMFLAASHVLAQVAMRYVKEGTARLRPAEWLKKGGDETFLWENGIAFPSGHVTIFASIVIPLAVLFPRLRPLLAIVAFVMLARVAVNAHFVSDVIGGVTLVALVTWACGWAIRPLRAPT